MQRNCHPLFLRPGSRPEWRTGLAGRWEAPSWLVQESLAGETLWGARSISQMESGIRLWAFGGGKMIICISLQSGNSVI